MDKSEITRLEGYLRKVLGSKTVSVQGHGDEGAVMLAGGAPIAEIIRDEDEGELSYSVSMGVSRVPGSPKNAPIDGPERTRMEQELRTRLDSPGLMVRPRPRKTDSAEVYVGEEFIGTLSREDSGDIGAFLTMSILDIDLDEAGV